MKLRSLANAGIAAIISTAACAAPQETANAAPTSVQQAAKEDALACINETVNEINHQINKLNLNADEALKVRGMEHTDALIYLGAKEVLRKKIAAQVEEGHITEDQGKEYLKMDPVDALKELNPLLLAYVQQKAVHYFTREHTIVKEIGPQ